MTRGQKEERPYFGLVTYVLVAGVKNLYRCHAPTGGGLSLVPFYQLLLDDELDLLDLRFLFSTGEHFRFLHDDPMVDYLRTSNSLRPASPVCGTLQGKP